MTAPAPAKALRPGHITQALRILFPRPVYLKTTQTGPGRFEIRLPATCAGNLGLAAGTVSIAENWLNQNLPVPVIVEGCEFPKRRYGEAARAVITISTAGGQR